jgi:putative transcriptional regulator
VTEPRLHLPDEGIFQYAGGASPEATALAVACHLTFCARCREEVGACEAVSAHLLESLPPAPLDPAGRDRLLAGLAAVMPEVSPPPVLPALSPELATLPGPLHPYLARANGRWRRLVPGARGIDLSVGDPGATARLMCFRPGFKIPLHDHSGDEYTIIFRGSLEDTGERARAGDVLYREAGHRHVQRVPRDDGDCVALVVNERPLVPLTLVGRVLKAVAGI